MQPVVVVMISPSFWKPSRKLTPVGQAVMIGVIAISIGCEYPVQPSDSRMNRADKNFAHGRSSLSAAAPAVTLHSENQKPANPRARWFLFPNLIPICRRIGRVTGVSDLYRVADMRIAATDNGAKAGIVDARLIDSISYGPVNLAHDSVDLSIHLGNHTVY